MVRKVQFGCGPHEIAGWENYDRGVDISKPLVDFKGGSVDYILAEHVIEHVTPQQGFLFLEECYRILVPGGVARISVPGLERFYLRANRDHLELMKKRNWIQAPTHDEAVRSCVFNFGHQSWYTEGVLLILMGAIGFATESCKPYESRHLALQNIDGHYRIVGDDFNLMESVIIEGTKE